MSASQVAITLAGAAALGGDFPPDVPDTPANQELWGKIQAEVQAIIDAGQVPDIPYDYTE